MNGFRRWLLLPATLLLTAVGSLVSPALAEERPVLFDQGHGQSFLLDGDGPADLASLAAEFRGHGLVPRTASGGITPDSLQDAGALVIPGPLQPITEAEVMVITNFLSRGGRLCLLLDTAKPANLLLRRLGVAATNAPIREKNNLLGDNPKAFRVTNFTEHPVTAGLTSFTVNGCLAVFNFFPRGPALAASSPRAWADVNGDGKMGPNEPFAALGVMVGGNLGAGAYVLIGDDAVFQNQNLTEGNLQLAKNLAAWLKGE